MLSKAEQIRSVEWGCEIDGCEAHRRGRVAIENVMWRGSRAYRNRPLLCRIGIHRHWHYLEWPATLKRCFCGYTWAYFQDM